jgi:predicted AlkP superfamily phosphohydrolase/phosphomutase
MNGSARVMVLGFDAMDPTTVRAMAAAGELPAFRQLLAAATCAPLRPPYGFYVESLWRSLWSSRSAGRTAAHWWEEIVAGTYERRETPFQAEVPFWRALDRAGRTVAVIDVPRSAAEEPGDGGIQISEMAAHDRHLGRRILPHAVRDELLDRFPLHPVLGVEPEVPMRFAPDDYVFREGRHRTDLENRTLLDGLLIGTDLKTQISTHLLRRGGWDLFFSVFGEAHSVGHQQWHLHDDRHPRHDPSLAATLGDPLAAVYRRLDAGLAEHLSRVDDATVVLVLLSHGMGPQYDGSELLCETLRRLDAARGGAAGTGIVGQVVHAHDTEEQRRRQRFFMTPSSSPVSGVRLNLEGREIDGRVAQGSEALEEMEWLRAALLEVINVDTGRPAVRAVERVEDHYPRAGLDSFPDLFVEWEREAPIDTVRSPRVGVVHRPYEGSRTGDHRPAGLLLALGPGIGRAGAMAPVDVEDIGPSIAAMLGVDLDDVDGRPVPWLSAPVAAGARSRG